MRCPFLREAQVKSCQTSAHRKLIVRLPRAGADELCSSPAYARCAGVRDHHEEHPDPARCPFLKESLVQYCAAAPVATYVPYSEATLSRCGGDAHRFCDAYLALARPPVRSGADLAAPETLWYAKNHLWLDVAADGTCHVGVDALLARALGRVERVDFVATKGTRRPSAVLVTPAGELNLVFPNTLRITAANPALRAHPGRVASDPYGQGWLFEGRETAPAAATAALLPGAKAAAWMRGESERLTGFVHELAARPRADGTRLVADGGEFASGLIDHLAREEALPLFAAFFSEALS